ncbi:hypothetical protein J7L87_06320 [bacterium]|nr:hypothetical protein [bacterium]
MRRRKFYVSSDIQKTFIIFVSVEIAIITAFFILILFITQTTYTNLLIQYSNPSPEITEQIVNLKKHLIFSLTLLLIGNVFLIGLASLFFSHKIAGPLFRFEKILNQITKGGEIPENFRLREKDFPKKLAKEIEKFFLFLKRKEEQEKERIKKLKELISSSSLSEEIKRKLEEIIGEDKE